MTDLADRVAAMRDRATPADQPREWYTVTPPGEAARVVYFCPAQTAADVRTLFYPGAGVVRHGGMADLPDAPMELRTPQRGPSWPVGTWVELSAKGPWEDRRV